MARRKSKRAASRTKASASTHQTKRTQLKKGCKKEQLVGKIVFIEKQGEKFILSARTVGGRLQAYAPARFIPKTAGSCSPDLLYIIPFMRYREDKMDGDLDIQGYVTAELICQGTSERMMAVLSFR